MQEFSRQFISPPKRWENFCLINLKWDTLSNENKALFFSAYMSKLWKTHCFREGNTRTVIIFCCQFAEEKGFGLDRTLFEKNSAYFRAALVASSAVFKDLGDKSKLEYLIKIIKHSIKNGMKVKQYKKNYISQDDR